MKIFNIKILILLIISSLLIINFVKAEVDTEGFMDTAKNVAANISSFIGSVCDNGNWFFRPLIGSECSQNLQFLLALVLWIFLFYFMYDAIATYSAFSNLASWGIAFGLVVILANSGVLNLISETIIDTLTTPMGLAIIIAITIVILIFYVIAKTMMIKEKKKRKEAEVEQSKQEVIGIAKTLRKGIEE